MNKKTNFGAPILLAALLGLSACVPTPETDAISDITVPEETVEAVETDDGVDRTDESEPVDSETSTEPDTGDGAQDGEDMSEQDISEQDTSEQEGTATETESETDSGSDAQPENETESTDETVVDNTPTKIEGSQCLLENVNDRGEIKFAPGTSFGTVEQSVLRDEADLYRFDANAGQTYEITINSLEDNAVFNFYAPTSGSVTTENDIGLNGILEEGGTYSLCVYSTARNATYELVLGIDP